MTSEAVSHIHRKSAKLESEAPNDSFGLASTPSEQPDPEVTPPPLQIVWRNVILMGTLHISAIYGIYLLPRAKLYTLIWSKDFKLFYI